MHGKHASHTSHLQSLFPFHNCSYPITQVKHQELQELRREQHVFQMNTTMTFPNKTQNDELRTWS